MILEADVREKLTDYLLGRVSLVDFESWLIAESWDMHKDSSRETQDLVWKIELSLSEYTSGHRTEAELRDVLFEALNNARFAVELRDDEFVAVERQPPWTTGFSIPIVTYPTRIFVRS